MGRFLLITFLAINILTFFNVRSDKNESDNSKNRTSETGIVTYAAFGGAAGALLAFKVFDHKTSPGKKYLRNNLYIMLVLNIVIYSSLYRNFKKRRR